MASKHTGLEYLGFQNKDTIIGELKSAKALLFPSIWYEGFPITIAEAMSTGTPTITSNMGGQAEIVEDGISGLHFDAGDPAHLAEKLRYFNEHPNDVKKMYKQTGEVYLEKYSPEKNYTLLMDIYNEVINGAKESNQH